MKLLERRNTILIWINRNVVLNDFYVSESKIKNEKEMIIKIRIMLKILIIKLPIASSSSHFIHSSILINHHYKTKL
jgi:hypothetical protein